MIKVINFQMSLFGHFADIKPEADVAIKLLTALSEKGFAPGSFDITKIDSKSGFCNETRMKMFLPNKTWEILFLPDRIDFNYNYQDGTEIFRHVNPLLGLGKILTAKVFESLESKCGNRIAVNCQLILENLTEDDVENLRVKYTTPFSVYNDCTFEEWSVKFNSRGNVKVSEDDEENCNRIVGIEKMQHRKSSSDITKFDVWVVVDVNTSEAESELIYNYMNLNYFADQANKFIEKVIMEFEGT